MIIIISFFKFVNIGTERTKATYPKSHLVEAELELSYSTFLWKKSY